MRRKDREVTDMAEIMEIAGRENVCCVAFHDEPCPYLVPMNYGARLEEGKLVLYFHGADAGTKMALLRKDLRASFTIVSGAKLNLHTEPACKSSESFESICGSGHAELVEGGKKKAALAAFMNHLGRPTGQEFEEAAFPEAAINSVAVWKITAEQVVAKRHE